MTDQNLQPSGTAMRAQTAAKKLGIYLPAAPAEFQESAVTHAQLRDLQDNPPEWLAKLRREGPPPASRCRAKARHFGNRTQKERPG